MTHLPFLLGLFGGAVLAPGAGAPLMHIPIVGTISYLRQGPSGSQLFRK